MIHVGCVSYDTFVALPSLARWSPLAHDSNVLYEALHARIPSSNGEILTFGNAAE